MRLFKNISPFPAFLAGLFFMLFLMVFVAASPPGAMYQPPITDSSLFGDGTDDEPLGVTNPVLYESYDAVLTQASTSAPTAYVQNNTVDTTAAPVWSRDSIGTYKVTRTDAWPDSTINIQCTIGLATAKLCKCYRQSDSTLIVRTEAITGVGVDLAGKLYLKVNRFPPPG